jgi:hypothetical protein
VPDLGNAGFESIGIHRRSLGRSLGFVVDEVSTPVLNFRSPNRVGSIAFVFASCNEPARNAVRKSPSGDLRRASRSEPYVVLRAPKLTQLQVWWLNYGHKRSVIPPYNWRNFN